MITYVEKHESLRRAHAFLSLSRLLLHATTLHPQGANQRTHDRFQSALTALNTRLEPCRSADELMMVAQSFARVVERYRRQVNGADSAREGELTRMLATLSETVTEIDRLKAQPKGLKAVLAARAPAQDEEPPASQEAGPAELPRSAAPPQPPPAPEEPRGRDPLTGLLLRRDAVDAISVYDGNRTHLYAAVVVMDGYQAFNRCHGPAAGDRAFSVLCRQLQNEFRPADRLFRWTPETVVALLVRPEPAVEVRSAVMGIAMKRHETTVQIGSRSVHIPIKCLAIAITSASPDPGDLVAKIDDFTAKRLRPHRA